MRFQAVQRILGILLTLFSLTMLPPVGISWWFKDNASLPFLIAFGLILGAGLLLWFPVKNRRHELRIRDGFMVVMLFWVSLSLSASIPILLLQSPSFGVTDAVFEAVSALTTTGATVIINIDELPPSILFYRQFLQWMGGMGIIVLAVAILPVLGIGGMQIYRAETPGPMKDTKLTPRITETAKALWYIYLSLTIACAVAYWLAGMPFFDAVAHSFSTVAIGGFSTHAQSIGYFNSPLIELVAMVFMFLSGINFALHFIAWRRRNPLTYAADAEFKAYICFIAFIAILTSSYLYLTSTFSTLGDALRHGFFQAISFSTTTGFTTADYNIWPSFLPVLLIIASFVGGCAGSTGGGLKVIRIVLLFKQSRREIVRLIHPNAQVSIRVSGKALPPRTVEAVWGFFAAYIITYAIIMLLLIFTGLDQVTAYSAVAACLNNLGPGLGDVGFHYQDINAGAKWILCIAMLLGRLEIFTLLVILSPTFWRA